jgi:hypothetical protein
MCRICCVKLFARSVEDFVAERFLSGRSAAWLARLVRDQEVEGSNPFAPTTLSVIRSNRYHHCFGNQDFDFSLSNREKHHGTDESFLRTPGRSLRDRNGALHRV